jgi:hypothetical protein
MDYRAKSWLGWCVVAYLVATLLFIAATAKADSQRSAIDPRVLLPRYILGSIVAATSVATSAVPTGTLSPSLRKAVGEAMLARFGIEPGSPKAEVLQQWSFAIAQDAEIQQLAGSRFGQAPESAPTPLSVISAAQDGMLTLTANDRARLMALISKVLDSAPADCGGLKDLSAVMSRYTITNLSAADLDEYFRLTFRMMKQAAFHAPRAEISEDQRRSGEQAVLDTLEQLVKETAGDRRDVAALIVNSGRISAEQWCNATRLSWHALGATPEPYRDWAIIGGTR